MFSSSSAMNKIRWAVLLLSLLLAAGCIALILHFCAGNRSVEPDQDGIVRREGCLFQPPKELYEESVTYATERFRELYDTYLQETSCRVFCALIPDKSLYLEPGDAQKAIFEEMERLYRDGMSYANPVSLSDVLSLSDYYRTDAHWREDRILPCARRLLEAMGKGDLLPNEDAFGQTVYEPFCGALARKYEPDDEPEQIVCLTGGVLDGCTVTDLSTGETVPLYDLEGCDPDDPYSLFLGGPRPVLRIDNPAAPKGNELILFRDSFGSSIAPLLCTAYRTVTVVDLRYLSQQVLPKFLSFSDQDVLFLFSEMLINNSLGIR